MSKSVHEIKVGDIVVSAEPISQNKVSVGVFIPKQFSKNYKHDHLFGGGYFSISLESTKVKTKHTAKALEMLLYIAEAFKHLYETGYWLDSKGKTLQIGTNEKGVIGKIKMPFYPTIAAREHNPTYRLRHIQKAYRQTKQFMEQHSVEAATEFEKQIGQVRLLQKHDASRQVLQLVAANSPHLSVEESLEILDCVTSNNLESSDNCVEQAKKLIEAKKQQV